MNLFNMIGFVEALPDELIIASLWSRSASM